MNCVKYINYILGSNHGQIMANITNSKKGQFFIFILFFFVSNNNFCSDIHYETHLELKYQSFCPNIDLGVMAQRCNDCIVGDHTLPSSQ